MAKKEDLPTMNLADCVYQLSLINNSLFSLKQGTKSLIDMVEKGNIEGAKNVISIFKMKESLSALTPE